MDRQRTADDRHARLGWAKVRRLRYFYNNTRFAGCFDFHGSPIAILKGRIICGAADPADQRAVSGLVVCLAYPLALPWLLYRSMRFHLSNTTWRNLRFAFLGDAKGALLGALPPIGIVVAAGAVSGLSMLISPFLGMGLLILTMLGFYGIGPLHPVSSARHYGGRPCRYQRIRPAYWRRTVLPGLPVAVGYMMAIGVVASVLIAMTLGVDIATVATKG